MRVKSKMGRIGHRARVGRARRVLVLARSLNLKSQSEWDALARSGKLPPGLPRAPHMVYADDGWSSWGDSSARASRSRAVVTTSSVSQYGRYGYRKVAALLRQAGWTINVKRVERIWQREHFTFWPTISPA